MLKLPEGTMQTKMPWRFIALLGLGSFSIGATTRLYDALMPSLLSDLLKTNTLIGLIMGLDNIIGLFVIPWFGVLSDRTWTRLGRRLPFLLVGLPIYGLGMMFLPFAKETGLAILLVTIVIMNLAGKMSRAPGQSLIPDLIQPHFRTPAIGIFLFVGGLGTILSLSLVQWLYGLSPRYPFLFTGMIPLLVSVLFLLFLREPNQPRPASDDAKPGVLQLLKEVVHSLDRPRIFFFLALLIYFMNIDFMITWFTISSEQQFGVPIQDAAQALLILTLANVLAAILAGFTGLRVGRRRMVAVGLTGMILSYVTLWSLTRLNAAIPVLIVLGICWAMVAVNLFPMAVELCRPHQYGTYTGLFLFLQLGAGIVGPALVGAVFDLYGSKRPLFLITASFTLVTLLLFSATRRVPIEAHSDSLSSPPGR